MNSVNDIKVMTLEVPKVDVEELIKEFKVLNVDMFSAYLKEVWRDLAQRSDEKIKGVNKITFCKYYDLPGIIQDRLYAVFDKNNNGYIDVLEFIEGMKILFSENFSKTSKFIFEFYDFNKDGFISKEDIRTVLSYVPLKTKVKLMGKFEAESYKDRIESQEELHEILERCFRVSENIDYNQFQNIIENVCSDIYFFILIFLLEKKPFSRQALSEYEKQKPFVTPQLNTNTVNTIINNNNVSVNKNPLKLCVPSSNSPRSVSTLVASPNLNSKFSPSITLSKSPRNCNMSIPGMLLNDDFSSENVGKDGKTIKSKDAKAKEAQDYLLKFAGRSPEKARTTKLKLDTNAIDISFNLNNFQRRNEKEDSIKIPVNRKVRDNLKNIDERKTENNFYKNTKVYNDQDLPITPAVKTVFNTTLKTFTTFSDKVDPDDENVDYPIVIKDLNSTSSIKYSDSHSGDTSEGEEEATIRCEGYMYKITDTKRLKKLWFKLLEKDFYYFKSEQEKEHKGMHNLSGLFVKEEKPTIIEKVNYFTFSVTYPKKIRFYYTDTEADMKMWVNSIKKATGFEDLTDIYEVKEKLGNGKFGLVRLGVHKLTGRKVAIKIMSKKDMNNQDLELLKTEIEILKICQHPNIIRIIDVFENVDFVYVIMEHCSGGDLFSYIEKRGFKLAENRACQIIHKLCTAVYYIHSYGIAHRDLKPENVLMTDATDDADIRLLDFGLSKIIGPSETCTEPYGTLSYVAPEVLIEQPYGKAVDMWSIGITTYLLLAGCLPFDHESSEREIARQTIHDSVRWGSIWKKLSNEAKSFVDNLLQKDPNKRMGINEVLEHPWIQKFNKTKLPELRKKTKDQNMSSFKLYASTDEVLRENNKDY